MFRNYWLASILLTTGKSKPLLGHPSTHLSVYPSIHLPNCLLYMSYLLWTGHWAKCLAMLKPCSLASLSVSPECTGSLILIYITWILWGLWGTVEGKIRCPFGHKIEDTGWHWSVSSIHMYSLLMTFLCKNRTHWPASLAESNNWDPSLKISKKWLRKLPVTDLWLLHAV